jgi:hypothetical protein
VKKNFKENIFLRKSYVYLQNLKVVEKYYMGKLMLLYCFILSVFPADAGENRRHIHIVRRGSKNAHRGDTVAKIWIEKNGCKDIEVDWSALSADEEMEILQVIDVHWEELNRMIDDVFAGKKVRIKKIK